MFIFPNVVAPSFCTLDDRVEKLVNVVLFFVVAPKTVDFLVLSRFCCDGIVCFESKVTLL